MTHALAGRERSIKSVMGDRGVKNKKAVLRFRAVNRDVFDMIRSGAKKVETRAATRKYATIHIMPFLHTERELRGAYYSYPNYRQKIKEFGIMAWEMGGK